MTTVKCAYSLAVLAVLAGDGIARADAPAQAETRGAPGIAARFLAVESFRLRATDDPDDSASDLRLFLDAAAESPKDGLELKSSLGLWWTLDGRKDEDEVGEPIGWASIHSRPQSPIWVDVYQLSAELRREGKLRLVRAGRQETDHGPPATFDGVAVLVSPRPRLNLFAFGGRTMHFFEIIEGLFEDWVGSVGAEILASKDLRVEVDYRLLKEDIRGDGEEVDITDSSYGVSAWWRRGDRLRARLYARGLDDELAYVGAQGRLQAAGADAGLDLRADFQPVTLDQLNELDDPYHLTLGESLPHGRVRLDAWKALALRRAALAVHAGLDGRFLLGDDETPFNRNFARAYVLASARDVLIRGLYASLVVEHDADDLSWDQGRAAVGGALGYERKWLKAEVGSFYHRYKYVYYQAPEEISNVRGFYGDVRLFGGAVSLRYGYEVFDRVLHTVTASLAQAY